MRDEREVTRTRRPNLVHKGRRLWFTREMERRFYFILTVILPAIGILYKIGVI